MLMDQIFEKTLLFDFYGELLTERQKELYQLYHLDDLSLGEISEQMDISRQGVYDAVKRCDKQLAKYEEKLQLVRRFIRNKERTKEIYRLTTKLREEYEMNELAQIENLTRAIIDDM